MELSLSAICDPVLWIQHFLWGNRVGRKVGESFRRRWDNEVLLVLKTTPDGAVNLRQVLYCY